MRRWPGTNARRPCFREAVLTEYVDRQRGLYRAAAFVDGRLEGALFVGPADAPPQWGDLRQMIGGPGIAAIRRRGLRLLRRRPRRHPRGAGLAPSANVAEIGLALRAGTKCGTCLPELRSIVAHERHAREHAHAV